ncbi:RNA 2',3'-cyclic phosphodiesterase [Thalassovita sp.]|uniref:RNA 2',3'-cyclic phosphodiesterase n=1 Tax=Thalassovita sp. TaxID=1979401 RepID=UPI0029DE71D6|nr:RNA 2',3'-cyclic phosphodiesterase [Thalassovita sp.]
MRLFVALDLPQGLRDALCVVQDGLGVGREVPEENLHLTLAFLDDQPSQAAEALHDMLSAIRAPQVRLTIRGVDGFGGKRYGLVAALVEKVPELISLQEKVAQAARMAGIDLPRRRFKPHVSLVRFPRHLSDSAQSRIGAWLALHGDLSLDGGDATQFSLYRSTLREEGPVYEPLANYPLLA